MIVVKSRAVPQKVQGNMFGATTKVGESSEAVRHSIHSEKPLVISIRIAEAREPAK